MARPSDLPELFSQASDPKGLVHINGRCLLQTRDARRVVSVSGIVLAQYAFGDRMSEVHAMVNLVDQGHADQNDVARAFCCSARAVGYPKGRSRLPQTRDRLVGRLKTAGWSNYEIARRVGVTEC